ncbi:MAG: Gldg family protein [Alphaproteobacteria bacterium]|nr:Gldg family protein [Alphaproteobacteria bacterium]
MEVMLRRWAWVFGFAGGLCLLASVSVYWLLERFDGRVTGFLVAGAVLLLVYAGLDRENLKNTASQRSFSYTTGSLLLQIVMVMIGIVGFSLAERYDKTWDFTEQGDYTLSEHTLKVIAGLDEPVRFLAFFGMSGDVRAERLLRLYDEASDAVQVEWIDPMSNPQKAQLYDVTSSHTLVLQQGDRIQRLESDLTEEQITQKLVIVQSDEDHIVCWAVGHGEADPDDELTADGLGGVVLAAESLNFQFLRANIATEGIDRKCEALVVARPLNDWLPFEREALAAYLAEGGRVMVLLDDPPILYAAAAALERLPPPPTPDGFVADLERFGVLAGNDLVVDPDPRNSLVGVDDGSVLVLSGQGIVHHAITESLGASVVLRVARSVRSAEDVQGITSHPLLRASVESWGETEPLKEPQPDLDTEVVGEVPVAVWAEIADPTVLHVVTPPEGSPPVEDGVPKLPFGSEPVDLRSDLGRAVPSDFAPKPGGRLVVFGDTDWATNQLYTLGNNRDLFLNTLAWLVDEEDQIGERPQPAETLEITGIEAGMLCLVSIVFVPGLAALLAVVTLVRRRFL